MYPFWIQNETGTRKHVAPRMLNEFSRTQLLYGRTRGKSPLREAGLTKADTLVLRKSGIRDFLWNKNAFYSIVVKF